MNIDKMKQQADENATTQDMIKGLQAKAISEFEKFFAVAEQSYSLWSKKRSDAVEQLVSDFCVHFTQHGFSTQTKRSRTSGDITEVEATYKGLIFKLTGINDDGEQMYLSNSQDIRENLWIDLPNDVPNYFVWKDNVVIGKNRLVDLYRDNKTAKDVYKQFVSLFNSEEELNQLISKVNINISHFQEAIERENDTYLCIHRHGTNDTYDSFTAFLDAME